MTYREGDLDPICVQRNPGLDEWRDGCCRFPKSCSPHMSLARAVELNTRERIAEQVRTFDPQAEDAALMDHLVVIPVALRCPSGEGNAIRWAMERLADRIVQDGLR